ncbi:XRE family transcriptional regulator [Streptomyces sp. NPDC058653]|uniref:XRE family transcriptional regulator n=1 Tax=Streptomyces sp. NPDC058653 TaxID=3346576 RepID=UPI0036611F63
MPRWKALPEELDPQVREFATQLRRLVDKSGLSIAAVSDRTGYSKTSWERYLNGRLLPPRGAILALAEVTGTNPLHLTTMWELSERAWSRSEMRHDMTMEAIRISQARDALGEFGGEPVGGPGGAGSSRPGGRTATPPGGGARTGSGPGPASGGWLGPEQPGANRPPAGAPGGTPPGFPPSAPVPPPGRGGGGRGRRRTVIFVAALVGALALIAGAVLLTDLGGGGDDGKGKVAQSASPKPTPTASELPAGVKCSGDECVGEDPELMGCGGDFAETATTATVGTAVVEVRYSETCGVAWARITDAAPGDTVEIAADKGEGKPQTGTVNADKDAYTPMVAVAAAAEAKACATLTTGTEGCTTPGQ